MDCVECVCSLPLSCPVHSQSICFASNLSSLASFLSPKFNILSQDIPDSASCTPPQLLSQWTSPLNESSRRRFLCLAQLKLLVLGFRVGTKRSPFPPRSLKCVSSPFTILTFLSKVIHRVVCHTPRAAVFLSAFVRAAPVPQKPVCYHPGE